ncbi:energy-coupling factor transporter transmembrane component T family protein [Agromyces atrinae]|uniref:Biotin transport system permease protein n=1 Tax=Agromyces atrinae TaxID=592376 RepID=A0A4Q2M4G0_9MICO|nr:CbiQ family ECF transporter T component [Agromyces atrinae]NYD67410.1 biotin transport system permease protein [Agromyces atrinae]RXZ86769.1 energy-coupling factor transporter transmembrane protein EcfT [Agromyces atrinae]
MIALYRPGSSVLHRMPAATKLVGFAIVALVVTLGAREPGTLAAAGISVCIAFAAAGRGLRHLGRVLVGYRWVIVLTLAPQLFFLPPVDALTNTGRVLAVILLAGVVTETTATIDLLDAIVRAARPLRRLIDPDVLALMLTIALGTVPLIADFARRVGDAHRARGIRPAARTTAVPLLVLSAQHADDLADALAARGIA